MICSIDRKTIYFQFIPPGEPVSFGHENDKQLPINRYCNDGLPNSQTLHPPKAGGLEANENDKVKLVDEKSKSQAEKEVIKLSENTEVLNGPQFQNLYQKPAPNLLGNIFPSVGIGVLFAESDIGKSTLSRQIALAIALGKPEVIGMPIKPKFGKSICVSTEEMHEDVWEGVMDQVHGFDCDQLPKSIRFIFKPDSPVELIKRELEKEKADIVVIDTFYNLTEGNMNLPNVVEPILNQLSSLAEEHKCLVVIVMHSAKSKALNLPDKNNLLGSRVIEGNARIVIELKRHPEDQGKVHFCVVKGNRVKDPEIKSKSYVLQMDDHRLFQSTGERVPFGEINKRKNHTDEATILTQNSPKGRLGRLTPEQKMEITQKLKDGEKQTVLSREYGVTQGAISQIWTKHNAS